MKKNLMRVGAGLPALLFIVMGLRWLVDPAGISGQFGLQYGGGLGGSSLVGDFGAFFLTLGLCLLLGLVTHNRLWFYPPIMLLLFAATGRVISWLLHDAAFAGQMIAFEVIVSLIILAVVKWYPESSSA